MASARAPVLNLWHGVLPAVALTLLFFAAPIAYTIALSFGAEGVEGPTLANYRTFFAEPRLVGALSRTLFLSLTVVALSSLIAYPLAYFLAFEVSPRMRVLLLFILVAPFWTSFTIRAFSWQLVLADSGVIAWAIERVTGTAVSLGFLYTMGASILGLTLFGIMLTTLMLFSVMVTIDRRLLEANAVLGGTRWTGFREIVLPLSVPGWLIGAVLTYIIAVGDYAVPALLGGGFRPVLAQVMLSVLKGTYDLPMAATFASILVLVILAGAAPLLLLVRQVRLQG
ncbi:MAG: ABC transporter permease subunit [Rhizobiales bacterium]|nr:ABC transporter permease subunit [Hyphomicrobiales bacterium]